MTSGSAAFNALVIFVVVMFLFPLSRLRKRDDFLEAGGGSILLVVFLLTSIRLVLPVETPFTYSIHCWGVMGAIHRFLRANPVIIWSTMIGWGLGAVPVACYEIRSFYRAYKLCHSLVGVECPRAKRAAKRRSIRCRVKVVPGIPIPFVAGLFLHTIYLPELDVSDKWLELILVHERQHIRSRDSWIKLFYSVLKSAFWWIEPFQAFGEDLDALLEIWCDRRVLASLEEDEKGEYVRMMLAMARRTIPSKCAPVSGLGGSSTKNSSGIAEQRMNILVNSVIKPRRQTMAVIGCCLVVALFFASYLVVFQPAGLPPENMFDSGVDVTYSGRCEGFELSDGLYDAFILKGLDGEYQLFINYEFNGYLTYDQVISEKYSDLLIYEEE